MPDSFFQSDKKRKRPRPSTSSSQPRRTSKPGKTSRAQERDEDLGSGSDAGEDDVDALDFRAGREDHVLSDDEIVNQNETAAEKRVRLAKGYLAKVRTELEASREDGDYDAAEIDRELIASRLQKDVSEAQGRIHQFLGTNLLPPRTRFLSTTSHSPTSVTLSKTNLFIASKRGSIHRYALPSLRKVGLPFGQAGSANPKVPTEGGGHRGEILCVAASEDGKYLVSGGRDKIVGVWNVEQDQAQWATGMRGHKDAVTSIAFPPLENPSSNILTASLSRHLALASLATLSVIDTFFGHQDSISSVSSLKPTSAVTAGSRDRTCRWWKVEEEVQLVFRGGGRTFEGVAGLAAEKAKERLGGGYLPGEEPVDEPIKPKGKGREFVEGSIDCVCVLDDHHFVSGGDSGSISLWDTAKKKPIFTRALAHGIDELNPESEFSMPGPRWITSLAALRGTNLFVSGSWDGNIKLWALEPNLRSFKPASVPNIPIEGFVNALQILALPPSAVDSSSWPIVTSEVPLAEVEKGSVAPRPKVEILLAAAIAQEPRLGRWLHLKGVRNGAFVAHVQLDEAGRRMLV